MLRRLGIVLIVLSVAGMAMAKTGKGLVSIHNLPVMNGTENYVNLPVGHADNHGGSALDSIGTPYQAGTTWYDYQHNGTAGHMISVDTSGYVHVVWMNGLNSSQNPRHVYYNVWDPTTQTFATPGGSQVNASTRAGYACCVATPDGFCFPAFHEILSGADAHSAVGIDFLPRTGAFTTFQPTWLNNMQLIWPKIAMSTDGKIHIATTMTTPTAGDPEPQAYSRGIPVFVGGYGDHITWETVHGASDQYFNFDTTETIAVDIAASKTSNRIAMSWTHPRDGYTSDTITQYNNDLDIMVSEDGGVNWGPIQNITNFAWPDYNCASGDTAVCDRDTFRLYDDTSILFDENDNIHVAFTVAQYYALEGLLNVFYSYIYHWDEQHQFFSPVAIGKFDSTTWTQAPGAWQRDCQRPCLSKDWTTGNLYCSFWRYDSLHVSAAGYPQADAFVTVSTDNGASWAEATNTTTSGHVEGAPAGQCFSERDVTIADHVTYDGQGDGWIHMSYILDKDAGACIQTPSPEGVATLNPVVYRRISINDIATSPILNPFWPVLRYDSTGIPVFDSAHERPNGQPESFALYQNYPNPFNPTTNIQFDLGRNSLVTLKVYNIAGQQVETLLDNQPLNAGVQRVQFDGSRLASGVYIYRVTANGFTASKKMVLMK